jgi:hypothetical protein
MVQAEDECVLQSEVDREEGQRDADATLYFAPLPLTNAADQEAMDTP